MVRKMAKFTLFSYLPIAGLFVASCARQPPEMAPSLYTARCASDVWIASAKEIHDNQQIESGLCSIVPSSDQALDLAYLFEIALSNNPQTERSWADAKEAAALYGISRADFYPKLSFDGNWMQYQQGFVFTDGSVITQTQSQETPLLELSYTFWDFGERIYKSRQYLYALDYANWNHNESIQNVLNKTASGYYNYLYQKALEKAADQDLKDAHRAFDAADQKMKSGIVDISDFLQAKTNYLQKKLNLTYQTGQQEKAKIALLNQLGLCPKTPICLGEFPEKAPLERLCKNAEYLMCMAEHEKPNLKAKRANVASKEAAFKRSKAEAMPKLTGTAEGGYTLFNQTNTLIQQYLLEVDLSFPIFAGFYYENQIRRAKADLDAAKAQLRETELSTSQQVMDSYTDFRVANYSIPIVNDYLVSAEKEFDSVLAHYIEGTNTIVDVLNSLSSLSDARAKYAKGMYELFSSMINLAFTTGTLYYSPATTPGSPVTKDALLRPIELFESPGNYEPAPADYYEPIPKQEKQIEFESIQSGDGK